MFTDLIRERGDTCVFYSDLIEGLEAVDDPEWFAILLDDAEPSGPVGWDEGFIHIHIQLALDDFANFVVYVWRNRDIALNPGLVWDCRDLYRWEEILAEVSTFLAGPSKTQLLYAYEVVEEFAFFG